MAVNDRNDDPCYSTDIGVLVNEIVDEEKIEVEENEPAEVEENGIVENEIEYEGR